MQLADSINLAIAIVAVCSFGVSALVAAITLKIARANREAAAIMKAQHESSTRPYIEVSPITADQHSLLLLRIRNSGASTARNVTLTMDRDFYFNAEHWEGHNLRKYAAFSEPIASLPPRCEITFMLGAGHVIFSQQDRCPPRFNVSASYDLGTGRVTETNPVDLQPFAKVATIKSPFLQQLEKMNEHFAAISASLSRTESPPLL